jgi:hypothetical protein
MLKHLKSLRRVLTSSHTEEIHVIVELLTKVVRKTFELTHYLRINFKIVKTVLKQAKE